MRDVAQHPNPPGWVVLVLAAIFAPSALADSWHNGETLVCSDCHTIHNSAGGQPMRYDGVLEPARLLLRADDPTQLCLSCHDGSRRGAPDVVAPTLNPQPLAGGFFPNNPAGLENPTGHDLLSAAPLTAPGSNDTMILSCVSCHSPHGNDSYRNLLEEPPGTGNSGPVTVVADAVDYRGGSRIPHEAGEQLYRSGIARWCNDCHGDFHGRTGNEEGAAEPWLRHPQDALLQGAYGVDFPHWSGDLVNRVPVESPTDDEVPSADDRVFCLSCHRAHGTDRPSALIWADGTTKLSTCQQCHNR